MQASIPRHGSLEILETEVEPRKQQPFDDRITYDESGLHIIGYSCICGFPIEVIDNIFELVYYCTNPGCCYSETKYRSCEVDEGDVDDDDHVFGDHPDDHDTGSHRIGSDVGPGFFDRDMPGEEEW